MYPAKFFDDFFKIIYLIYTYILYILIFLMMFFTYFFKKLSHEVHDVWNIWLQLFFIIFSSSERENSIAKMDGDHGRISPLDPPLPQYGTTC